ncbi:hypothetical protein AMJ44_00930 [candidate division WOR-1 bacterium DG_54_3]|uniref:DUF8058 domain-containing protein n=1 Tax=candidate division WOR-1 bacterium DG_54_3 TaxID=1703775 RepID=A0A0S7Y5N3_UNCSA|nr:MAG: hypothetical protein AMJ44_00930 [candidate division WOR-1 bacterium DG_54_3]
MIALGIIMFWIAFFTTDLVNISDPRLKEAYLAFESAFPFADFYLSFMLIIGGVGLLKKMPYGYFFSLVAGASLIFLGLLDVSFNVQNGIYFLGAGEALLNIVINSICLGFGTFLLLKIWKDKRFGKTEMNQG